MGRLIGQGDMKKIDDMVKELPEELQREVRRYVQSLIVKRGRKKTQAKVSARRRAPKPRRPLKLDWRGGLRGLRSRYTSVELQHKALDWWGD